MNKIEAKQFLKDVFAISCMNYILKPILLHLSTWFKLEIKASIVLIGACLAYQYLYVEPLATNIFFRHAFSKFFHAYLIIHIILIAIWGLYVLTKAAQYINIYDPDKNKLYDNLINKHNNEDSEAFFVDVVEYLVLDHNCPFNIIGPLTIENMTTAPKSYTNEKYRLKIYKSFCGENIAEVIKTLKNLKIQSQINKEKHIQNCMIHAIKTFNLSTKDLHYILQEMPQFKSKLETHPNWKGSASLVLEEINGES